MNFLFLANKNNLNPLVSYIDLLFLLVCFFIFLVNAMTEESFKRQEFVQQVTKRLGYPEQDLQQAEKKLEELSQLAELGQQFLDQEKAKQERFQQRAVVKIEYNVASESGLYYQGEYFEVQNFLEQIIQPIRQDSWINFISYASPDISFGKVVKIRQQLLKNREEFDTFWSSTDR